MTTDPTTTLPTPEPPDDREFVVPPLAMLRRVYDAIRKADHELEEIPDGVYHLMEDARHTLDAHEPHGEVAGEVALLRRVNAALLAYAECGLAYADLDDDGSTLRSASAFEAVLWRHGWDGNALPLPWMIRIGRTALALHAKGGAA